MLPEQYTDDWFTRNGKEQIHPGMALYDSEQDEFITVYSVERYTAYLEHLSDDTSFTVDKDDIENNLYDRYIPCEVRC